MTMDTLASIYYVVTSIGVLVATLVNVALYWRSRPNRMQQAIDSSLRPVEERLRHIDREIEDLHESAAKGEALAKAIDHEVTRKLEELDAKLDEVVTRVAGIPTAEDIRTLHHRVTEVAKQAAHLVGQFDANSKQLSLIHSFLLQGGNRAT